MFAILNEDRGRVFAIFASQTWVYEALKRYTFYIPI